jgi:hypothetical protein
MNSSTKTSTNLGAGQVSLGDWAQWHWTLACRERDELLDTLSRAERALPRGSDEYSRVLRAERTLRDLADHVCVLKAFVCDSEIQR